MIRGLRTPRRTPPSFAAALAVTLLFTLVGPAGAASPAGDQAVAVDGARSIATSALVPGSVNRTSLHLRTTYAATLRLNYRTRAFAVHSAATITNTSGGPIDRVELNTAAARLGGMDLRSVMVDGVLVRAGVRDQTIVVPLGGVLPAGASTVVRVKYAARLRTSLSGSSWLFTKVNGIVDAYRWLPWVSKATPFTRPNHGDPFVTPSSPLVRLTVITDRKLVIATTGDRVFRSADGLTQRFEARNVRDVTITAAPDYRTREASVGRVKIRYYYRSAANAGAILDAAVSAFRKIQARLGPYPYATFKIVQSAGGYGMESPRLIWIPYGVGAANLRYLVAHETAHQWFYGLVGNDQARQPFADEAAADFVARYVTSTKRSSRCATARLDRKIYDYGSTCYYEVIYIQGGNLIDAARKQMGSTRFWAAMHTYISANRYGLGSNAKLLETLDDGTPLDLGARLFAPRFPLIY